MSIMQTGSSDIEILVDFSYLGVSELFYSFPKSSLSQIVLDAIHTRKFKTCQKSSYALFNFSVPFRNYVIVYYALL